MKRTRSCRSLSSCSFSTLISFFISCVCLILCARFCCPMSFAICASAFSCSFLTRDSSSLRSAASAACPLADSNSHNIFWLVSSSCLSLPSAMPASCTSHSRRRTYSSRWLSCVARASACLCALPTSATTRSSRALCSDASPCLMWLAEPSMSLRNWLHVDLSWKSCMRPWTARSASPSRPEVDLSVEMASVICALAARKSSKDLNSSPFLFARSAFSVSACCSRCCSAVVSSAAWRLAACSSPLRVSTSISHAFSFCLSSVSSRVSSSISS
mmetsp:Transcript_40640/g.101647  ORF Transcript_40640/g.101647 Transcript_40640/m.101647 type:complete len:272 (-) Transcript_40640:697-1512(-)